jgi:hypothetical protein
MVAGISGNIFKTTYRENVKPKALLTLSISKQNTSYSNTFHSLISVKIIHASLNQPENTYVKSVSAEY